jgi:RNA polymerase sigma-70 factor (ECF subfamily)
MGEKDLIKGLKKGKEEAYYELINTYGDQLLRTCFLMTKDEKLAEDIVQESFIRVFKYIKGFKGDSSLYTWIYRISQNVLKDKMKSKVIEVAYEDYYMDPDNPEDLTLIKIDRQILRKELDRLSFIYKQVLVLFYFEDRSIKEISAILEEKEGTIKSKLSRGRSILKQALEKGGEFNG